MQAKGISEVTEHTVLHFADFGTEVLSTERFWCWTKLVNISKFNESKKRTSESRVRTDMQDDQINAKVTAIAAFFKKLTIEHQRV